MNGEGSILRMGGCPLLGADCVKSVVHDSQATCRTQASVVTECRSHERGIQPYRCW